MEISKLTASQIIKAINDCSISSEQLLEYNYFNIQKYNSKYNALINIKEFSKAKAEAIASDVRRREGKKLSDIDGLTFVIKDNIIDKDFTTTCASKNLNTYMSNEDATVVDLIKKTGGIIIGKSNLDQYGMGSFTQNSIFGRTINPLDESVVCGGSSGGSAVAVALAMAVIGIGSDTGGSVRQPASYCGLCGFKPTYGLISRYGLISYASSLDTIGFISNDVDSISSLLDICVEDDNKDSTHRVLNKLDNVDLEKQYSFATFPSISDCCEKEVFEQFNEIEKKIESSFCITDIKISSFEPVLASYYFLATAEACSNLGRYDGIRYGSKSETKSDNYTDEIENSRSNFMFETKKRIILGNYVLSSQYFDKYYTKSLQIRNNFSTKINQILEKFDGIILPTTSTFAKKLTENITETQVYKNDILTIFANMTGIPAISFCLTNEKKSIGIQILSKKYSDKKLLHIAQTIFSKLKE